MKLDMSKVSRKQDAFLRDAHRHVAYGGARGGGKSWGVRTKAKILAASYPGIKILIVRRTYPELQNNHIAPLREELTELARYNDSRKQFSFPNGSTISFGYCNAEKDLGRYQGAEYDVIFFDEAGQLPEEWLKKINACVRGVNGFPKRSYYTLNPGGVSHGYFKRLFVERRFEKNENPADYSFIQAKATDNLALMDAQPEYMDYLNSLPPTLRRMWRDGDWSVYAGQFFEEFRDDPEHYEDRRFTHVIEPFDIPEDWPIYRSYDWGYHKPFSCGWWTVDYDGVAYRILELYGCKDEPNEGVRWNNDEQFTEIARIERTHPWLTGRNIRGVADPSIWNENGGISVAETAMRHGIYFDKGDNQRIPGWMQVHYRMAFDTDGYARMYIFRNCRAFIRTVPLLMYDEHHMEDVDTTMEDHVADEVRYFCMMRPVKPQKTAPKKTILADPLDQLDVQPYRETRRILHG